MEILLSNQSKSSPVSPSKLFDFLIYSKAMAADAAVSVSLICSQVDDSDL